MSAAWRAGALRARRLKEIAEEAGRARALMRHNVGKRDELLEDGSAIGGDALSVHERRTER